MISCNHVFALNDLPADVYVKTVVLYILIFCMISCMISCNHVFALNDLSAEVYVKTVSIHMPILYILIYC